MVSLRAHTLVETLAAMSILSLVSGFALMIFLAVSSPRSSLHTLLLAQQKSSEILDTITGPGLAHPGGITEVPVQYLLLSREVRQEKENLKSVEIRVSDNTGTVIYTRKRLYYAATENFW